jgi:hypothetical protein
MVNSEKSMGICVGTSYARTHAYTLPPHRGFLVH